ncbi:MAG: hypothetical protein NT085_01715 [candidate division SR1 bacterium]|nr:hypothetical protein [candidate division SR1 bacterium]
MSKEKNSKKDENPSRTRRIINKIRGKVVSKKNPVVIVGTTHISSARPTRLPQISSEGLSHAGKHLLLLIQHSVDEKKVKVPVEHLASWGKLLISNPEFIDKKNHIKELCSIHHFSSRELEDIAYRVTLFVAEHQPHNVNI